MMRILILHKWLIMGGIERILINYLKLLAGESNIQIDLLIAFDTHNNVFSQDIPPNINVHYIFDKSFYTKKMALYQNRHNNILTRIIQKIHRYKEKRTCHLEVAKNINNYDLIINFSNHFDKYIPFNKTNKPIVRWQHLAFDERFENINNLKKYHKVIAICKEMENDLKQKTNIASDKLTHIFNPLKFEEIKQLAQESITIEKPYLIQVARLDKIKRHCDLIDIYNALVKKGIKHKLYIIGDGSEYNALNEQIKQLGLENQCILLGEIKNPYPYIKNADLFLHTSEREGLPTVLLESAILDTVIIAMNCPTGPKEIINDGECGELIALGDKSAFIERAYNLINDTFLQQQYKSKMRKHINLFSEEKVKNDLLNLINEMTNNKGSL